MDEKAILEEQLIAALTLAQQALTYGTPEDTEHGKIAYVATVRIVNQALNAANNKNECPQCAGSGVIMLGEDLSEAQFLPCECTEEK